MKKVLFLLSSMLILAACGSGATVIDSSGTPKSDFSSEPSSIKEDTLTTEESVSAAESSSVQEESSEESVSSEEDSSSDESSTSEESSSNGSEVVLPWI